MMLEVTTAVTTVRVAAPNSAGSSRIRRRNDGRFIERALELRELGAYLRRVRGMTLNKHALPLSRAELARRVNRRLAVNEPPLSEGIITRVENGEHYRGVPFLHLRQICRGLNLALRIDSDDPKIPTYRTDP